MSRPISMQSLLWGVLVVACFLLYLPPWIPTFPIIDDPDVDFGIVLSHAFAHGWQFGRDIIYTFGPFGFLYDHLYDPATYPLKIAIWVGMSLIVGLAVATIVDKKRPILTLLALVSLLVALKNNLNVFFYAGPVLLPLIFFHPDRPVRRWLLPLLVLLCAFISLIKFTFFVVSLALILLIEGYRILERRFFPALLLPYAALMLLFYSLGGQQLTNLDDYFGTSLIVAGGYSQAMQVFGDVWEIGVFFVITGAFLLISALTELRLNKRQGSIVLLGLAFVCLMIFKAGFARHDHGHTYFAWSGMAALLVLAYLARIRRAFSSGALGVTVLIGAFLMVALSGSWWLNDKWRLDPGEIFLRQLPTRGQALAGFVFRGRLLENRTRDLTQKYQRALAEVRMETGPLRPIEGSADIYPWGAAIMIAHGLDYRPRPVFQSFVAYTSELVKANRDYLRGESAPDWLFVGHHTIDYRYLALDDGFSWPDILERYDPAGREFFGHSIWKRRAAPRTVSIEDSGAVSVETSFDKPVHVPGDWNYVWATVDMKKTLFGKIASILYKSARIDVSVALADGTHFPRRIIPALTRAGFLLSPHIDSPEEFPLLVNGQDTLLSPLHVVRITVPSWRFGNAVHWFYDEPIRMSFRRLIVQDHDETGRNTHKAALTR